MNRAAGDTGFTKYKSLQVVSWSLVNMHRLGDHPSIGLMGQPFAGRTVFVIGAGPSLASNVDALRAHAERGHPVVCVNAAGAPLKAAGITPDVMVVRESLDLTDQIEATDARLIAVDVSIHPDTWQAAAPRLAWFLPMYPRQSDIGLMLGEPMIAGGPAALCSSVAISLYWGAARVVLVGCDLAFARDGSAYHPEAPRGTLRHETSGEGEARRLCFSGDAQDDERCKQSGQMVPPKSVRYTEVMSHDWATWLPTINVYQDQRTWLTTQATRHGERVELLNASEGGSGVPGWQAVELAEAEHAAGPLSEAMRFERRLDMSPRIPQHRIKAAIEETRRSASVLEMLSREMLSTHGPDLRALASVPLAAQGSPMAEALSASRLLERPSGSAEAKIEYTYGVMRAAAQEAQRILGGKT